MAALRSDDTTRADINRDWLIKYRYYGETDTHLIAAGQYHKLVTEKIAQTHFARVLRYDKSKHTFKIRKSLKINFLQK